MHRIKAIQKQRGLSFLHMHGGRTAFSCADVPLVFGAAVGLGAEVFVQIDWFMLVIVNPYLWASGT
jgi:hypothetical protein